MSTSTRSKRSASDLEAETSKKVKSEEGEPIPVEEAAAAEEMMPADPNRPLHDLQKPSEEKGSLAAQIDLSHRSPTDPNAFNDFLFALLAHKAENNNFHVSREENPHLHVWLGHLKREYKSFLSEEVGSSLTEVQVKVLEHLHVPLTSRGDDHWNRFYQLLQAYADRHGHVLVPRLCEIPGLGDWVTDQRRQFKAWKQGQATQLTPERRQKLEDIGFAWQVRNRPEWEARFQELLEYKQKHGDCKVRLQVLDGSMRYISVNDRWLTLFFFNSSCRCLNTTRKTKHLESGLPSNVNSTSC